MLGLDVSDAVTHVHRKILYRTLGERAKIKLAFSQPSKLFHRNHPGPKVRY